MGTGDERDARTPPPSPACAAPADEVHAGVHVLSNRVLWDLITGFMSGYPLAVGKFYHDNKKFRRLMRLQRRPEDGVLPHLAIAVNDPDMLQMLYSLAKCPEHRGDPKLSFANVIRCAVEFKRVEMLECISHLKASDPDWDGEPSLMLAVLRQHNPDILVLDWLFRHLPLDTLAFQIKTCLPLRQRIMLAAIASFKTTRQRFRSLYSTKHSDVKKSRHDDSSMSTSL